MNAPDNAFVTTPDNAFVTTPDNAFVTTTAPDAGRDPAQERAGVPAGSSVEVPTP